METDNPFEKVLDRLREKGWSKGSYNGPNGSRCIKGAVRDCNLPVTVWWHPIADIITDQYPERQQRGNCDIAFFNDHPDTTFSDVERVLEKAAIQWEEERVLRD